MSDNRKDLESAGDVESSKNQAGSQAQPKSSIPNPEAKPPVKRRYHTAQYKLEILSKADALESKKGAVAALLRREGLYSSHLSKWKHQRDSGAFTALSVSRGRKPKHDAKDLENAQLRRENEKLKRWKNHAELIMDAQKKIAQLLGNPVHEDSLPKLPNLDLDV